MAIEYEGIKFDTVEELIDYKRKYEMSEETKKQIKDIINEEEHEHEEPEKVYVPVKSKIITPNLKNSNMKWKPFHDKQLKDTYKAYTGKELTIKLYELGDNLGRSVGSLRARASERGYTKQKISKKVEKESKVEENEDCYMINNKAKVPYEQIKRDPNHIPTIKKKSTYIENFPTFESIDKNYIPILEGMIKNVLANNGNLNYLSDGWALGITDGNKWRDLVEEFANKQEQIKEYFGINGIFTITKLHGKYHVIRYEK